MAKPLQVLCAEYIVAWRSNQASAAPSTLLELNEAKLALSNYFGVFTSVPVSTVKLTPTIKEAPAHWDLEPIEDPEAAEEKPNV